MHHDSGNAYCVDVRWYWRWKHCISLIGWYKTPRVYRCSFRISFHRGKNTFSEEFLLTCWFWIARGFESVHYFVKSAPQFRMKSIKHSYLVAHYDLETIRACTNIWFVCVTPWHTRTKRVWNHLCITWMLCVRSLVVCISHIWCVCIK